jgi:hypothetical protein
MERSSIAIEPLRARAEKFRERAAGCQIPRYSELMHKGAVHLDEHARLLEARLPISPEFASRN